MLRIQRHGWIPVESVEVIALYLVICAVEAKSRLTNPFLPERRWISMYLSRCIVCLGLYLSIYLSPYLYIYLSLCIYLSIYLDCSAMYKLWWRRPSQMWYVYLIFIKSQIYSLKNIIILIELITLNLSQKYKVEFFIVC